VARNRGVQLDLGQIGALNTVIEVNAKGIQLSAKNDFSARGQSNRMPRLTVVAVCPLRAELFPA